MFFQFSPALKQRPKQHDVRRVDEEAELVLAPFSANPKLCFDDVRIGTSVKKTLRIKNPGSHDVQMFITKAPPRERRLVLSWSECRVPCQGEVILELEWLPEVEGGWRDLLVFEDGGRLKKDVVLIFKSVTQKKISTRGSKVVSSKAKSPLKRVCRKPQERKQSPVKIQRSPLKNLMQMPTINIETPSRRGTYTIKDKENFVFQNYHKEKVVEHQDKFYDSLEQSFDGNISITETLTPVGSNKFTPKVCSTELQVLKPEVNSDLGNISSSTYVKGHNISTETYTIGNNSTYTKDDDLLDLSSTPKTKTTRPSPVSLASLLRVQSLSGEGVKNITEANLWCTGATNARRNLQLIVEESFAPAISHDDDEVFIRSLRKRKSDCNLKTSPTKYLIRQAVTKPSFSFVGSKQYSPSQVGPQYYEFKTTDEQEERFTKWLNALLTPPEELDANTEREIDVAKLWQQCKQREVSAAPTRELVSNKYHVNRKLEALRASAVNLLRTSEISTVLTQVLSYVDEKKLVIRTDRNVHLDLGLQQEIMLLFLSYNPLWLRIGLETIYRVVLPLKSNSDVVGLSTFIVNNFFKSPALLKRYKSSLSPQYAVEIKKFMLKKFLTLVYFLDQAKTKRLIMHDPCLFCKNAPIKQSCEILLRFARDTLSAIGDVTRFLRPTGYILVHQQTYIHEFDYAVKDLGSDLRDGVRLTRTVEIILAVDDLTSRLRVPAISRLQKIHNMKVVFEALNDAEFEILYDVTPKDIVDGHREKTFSFLWQIIYKFQGRRFEGAAVLIQKWWRSLRVTLKRRILTHRFEERRSAVFKIEEWYRRIKFSAKLTWLSECLKFKRRWEATVKIQSFYRMSLARREYLKQRGCIVSLQSHARRWLVSLQTKRKISAVVKIQAFIRMHLARKRYLRLKHTVLRMEQRYIALMLMENQRASYARLKTVVISMQARFRSVKEMRRERNRFLTLRKCTVLLQRRFRATRQMRVESASYLKLRESVLCVQTRFRANQEMKAQRKLFLQMRESVIAIQRWFRANKAMKAQRKHYGEMKESAVIIQRRFRALKIMERQRKSYATLRMCATLVQQRFRANRLMKIDRFYFLRLRESVIFVQRHFRANKTMEAQRKVYVEMKESAVVIQRRFRALKTMERQRESYVTLRKCAKIIQQRYRANRLMKADRGYFLKLTESVVFMQKRFRANKAMQAQQKLYVEMKDSSVVIQRRFRALKTMERQRESYVTLKRCASLIQQRYRANRLMKANRLYFLKLRESVIFVQSHFRANKAMEAQRKAYVEMKKSAVAIQRRFRALKAMEQQRENYVTLKRCASLVQQRYRANRLMKANRLYFLRLRKSVVFVQGRFRANKAMQAQRKLYVKMKESAMVIQRRFRALKTMEQQRESYITLKRCTSLIQQRYRANKLVKANRLYFLRLRESVVFMQGRFRANKAMQAQREHYIQMKESAMVIQKRFRALKLMKQQRESYVTLKRCASLVQQRYRANRLMKANRLYYLRLRESVVFMQERFRANKVMQAQRKHYMEMRRSAVVIQRRFRALKTMERQRASYVTLRRCTTLVQQWYRANRLMKIDRLYFLRLRESVVFIQKRFRANKAMQAQRKHYVKMRESAVVIQRRFRALKTTTQARTHFLALRKSAVVLQRLFRAKRQCAYYCRLREAVLKVQRRFRAKVEQRRCHELIRATIQIQPYFKSRLQHDSFVKFRSAAIIIQRWYRRIKYAQRLTTAVAVVQSRFKAVRAMQLERKRYLALRRAAVLVQRRFRQKRSEKRRQELLRAVVFVQDRFRANRLAKTEKKREEALRNSAATKIQAAWRGYRTRSTEETHVTNIRNKIEAANKKKQPENTLSYRTSQAKLILTKSYESLIFILEALRTLELTTRISEGICLNLSSCISHELYRFMKSTCRSLPDITACTLATSILINFCKHPPARANCWCEDHIDDVLSIMGYSCDKEGLLFPYLCTLLWLFAHNEEYKRAIVSVPKFKQRIVKIQQQCKRKQEMVQRTPVRFQSAFTPCRNLPLPSLEPDWGIVNPNRPRTFTNSIHALQSLLVILEGV